MGSLGKDAEDKKKKKKSWVSGGTQETVSNVRQSSKSELQEKGKVSFKRLRTKHKIREIFPHPAVWVVVCAYRLHSSGAFI